jgi:hypothetical protein
LTCKNRTAAAILPGAYIRKPFWFWPLLPGSKAGQLGEFYSNNLMFWVVTTILNLTLCIYVGPVHFMYAAWPMLAGAMHAVIGTAVHWTLILRGAAANVMEVKRSALEYAAKAKTFVAQRWRTALAILGVGALLIVLYRRRVKAKAQRAAQEKREAAIKRAMLCDDERSLKAVLQSEGVVFLTDETVDSAEFTDFILGVLAVSSILQRAWPALRNISQVKMLLRGDKRSLSVTALAAALVITTLYVYWRSSRRTMSLKRKVDGVWKQLEVTLCSENCGSCANCKIEQAQAAVKQSDSWFPKFDLQAGGKTVAQVMRKKRKDFKRRLKHWLVIYGSADYIDGRGERHTIGIDEFDSNFERIAYDIETFVDDSPFNIDWVAEWVAYRDDLDMTFDEFIDSTFGVYQASKPRETKVQSSAPVGCGTVNKFGYVCDDPDCVALPTEQAEPENRRETRHTSENWLEAAFARMQQADVAAAIEPNSQQKKKKRRNKKKAPAGQMVIQAGETKAETQTHELKTQETESPVRPPIVRVPAPPVEEKPALQAAVFDLSDKAYFKLYASTGQFLATMVAVKNSFLTVSHIIDSCEAKDIRIAAIHPTFAFDLTDYIQKCSQLGRVKREGINGDLFILPIIGEAAKFQFPRLKIASDADMKVNSDAIIRGYKEDGNGMMMRTARIKAVEPDLVMVKQERTTGTENGACGSALLVGNGKIVGIHFARKDTEHETTGMVHRLPHASRLF